MSSLERRIIKNNTLNKIIELTFKKVTQLQQIGLQNLVHSTVGK